MLPRQGCKKDKVSLRLVKMISLKLALFLLFRLMEAHSGGSWCADKKMGWHLISFLMVLLFSLAVGAQNSPVCQDHAFAPSTEGQRTRLLALSKRHLLNQAQQAIQSLEGAKSEFRSCQDALCSELEAFFVSAVREQNFLAKIARAIAEKRLALQGGLRSPRTIGEVMFWIQNNHVHHSNIAVFDLRGLRFTEEEKEAAKELWTHVFIRTANRHPSMAVRDLMEMVRHYFQVVAENLNYLNPLLAFVDGGNIETFEDLVPAFDRLIKFNRDFIDTIEGLETRHERGFWSYPNLTMRDHEMGLVNFTDQIGQVIANQNNPNVRKGLCNAWNDLSRQQTLRIRASIGVGFATAVVCGAGIWSGLGTVPSLLVCAPAIADGLWGARRGFLDAQLASRSVLAGRSLFGDAQFTDGILSPDAGISENLGANLVFLVNLVGIIPVGKSVAFAHAGVRGPLIDLFTLPATDMSVSIAESSAANIVYLTMALRGVEDLHEEFQEEIERLTSMEPQAGTRPGS